MVSSNTVDDERLSMSQLSAKSQTPVRTVRHYIASRLLPSAVGKGRYAYYTGEHLRLLEQIKPHTERGISVRALLAMRDQSGGAKGGDPYKSSTDTLTRRTVAGFIQVLVDREALDLLRSEERELLDVMSRAAQRYLSSRARGSRQQRARKMVP